MKQHCQKRRSHAPYNAEGPVKNAGPAHPDVRSQFYINSLNQVSAQSADEKYPYNFIQAESSGKYISNLFFFIRRLQIRIGFCQTLPDACGNPAPDCPLFLLKFIRQILHSIPKRTFSHGIDHHQKVCCQKRQRHKNQHLHQKFRQHLAAYVQDRLDQQQNSQCCRTHDQSIEDPQLSAGIDGMRFIFPEPLSGNPDRHLICQLGSGRDDHHKRNKLKHTGTFQRRYYQNQKIHGYTIRQAQRHIEKTTVTESSRTHRHIYHFHAPSKKCMANHKKQKLIHAVFHFPASSFLQSGLRI